MKSTAAVLVTTIVAITTLAGCGGGSDPYCDAVDKNKSTLDSFGRERTNQAYATYAKAVSAVAKQAPASIKKDWSALANVTTGVIDAQDKAGIKLEDMKDKAKLGKLTPDQLSDINAAYKAFNKTIPQRNAVVKNVLQECKTRLK